MIHRLCEEVPTHNVAMIGEDAYVFLRSPGGQVSEAVPGLRLGAPQLLGHYVVDTLAQFEAASGSVDAIESSLSDTHGGAIDPVAVLQRVAAADMAC